MTLDNIILKKVFKSPKKIKVIIYDRSDALDMRWWLKRNKRDFDVYQSLWNKDKYIFKIYGGENGNKNR